MFANRKSAQAGFTLIEILVALALITLLAVGISLAFDGSRSRAQALVSTMSELAAANVRLKVDTGCYASKPALLFDSGLADDGSTNFCGKSLKATWNGPYVAPFTIAGTNDVNMDKVADGAVISFGRDGIAGGAWGTSGKKYMVVATDLPEDIVTAALFECNGVEADADDFVDRKCRGSAADGTFDMLFDETR
jgi:prepilin-type N-terminal cleavage/methylation domain-containing protein